jgi:hypothetical protein
VRVRHERENALVKLLLDVPVEAAGGDEVEIAERLLAERAWNRRTGADDALTKGRKERLLLARSGRDDGAAGRGGCGVDETGRGGGG